jgi:diguanylate cyclase (GGDEF)-like protein/PAS domain S-box-containing protein
VDKEKILVVDCDSSGSVNLIEKLLSSSGYEILTAENGRGALETARSQEISLLLLDFQLPDISGLDVLRWLSEYHIRIPVILMTNRDAVQIPVDAFRLGVTDCLSKPINGEMLKEAIKRTLAPFRLEREKKGLIAQLKDQVSWINIRSEVIKGITSTLNLDVVLRRIVESGVHITGAEEGFLALLDRENGQLYLRAVKNIDEDKSKTIRLPIEDTLIGEVIHSRRPYRTERPAEAPLLKLSTGFLVRSLLYVPLISKGKTLGVLAVINHNSYESFTVRDEELLTSLADYAAVALENASLYEQSQQEIIERKRIEQALRESEERYALAVRGANDGLWDWDLRSNQIYFSPRWKTMLGYAEEEIGGSPREWWSRIHPEDSERVKLTITSHLKGISSHFESEHRMLHKDGTYRWMLSRGLAVCGPDGSVVRMAGSQSDITDRKVAEEKLLHDAFYDTLTGLPNRALFMDRLKYAIEHVKRRKDDLFAVLFLDLDRFKDINDSLGHMVGDELLIEIAKMLRGGLRATDMVARFGGDEFVILLDDIESMDAVKRIADWVQQELKSLTYSSEHEFFISTSIGIVWSAMNYQRAEEVLRDADIAMYSAKAHGKARYAVFDPSMRERIMNRLALETDLRQSIENHELWIEYQPIISLKNGRLSGFEALVRWQHPERGLLLPGDFISLAEDTGLIIAIDRWVLRQACHQLRLWQIKYPQDPPLTMNVNLSGKQIVQPDLIQEVKNVLEETGLKANTLKLEITESVIMENNEITSEAFKKLNQVGVQIQIDDFGTGYSSLGYLHKFPVNALKVDRSFVQRLGVNGSDPDIVGTVLTLAHDLGMEAVAEGMETDEQLQKLKDLGCEYGQGYIVSEPLGRDQAEELIRKRIEEGMVDRPEKVSRAD